MSKPKLNKDNDKSVIVYKLTTQAMTTHKGFKWELGVAASTDGEGELCGPGWLHYYHSPLLAVLLNRIHANIHNPRLFKAEASGAHKDDNGLKGGCTVLRLVEEMKLPMLTNVQRRAFAILCAQQVYDDKDSGGVWSSWAEKWLSGEDRTEKSRKAATYAATYATTYATTYAAADAAATYAADADATYAADAARSKKVNINFQALAEQAMTYV